MARTPTLVLLALGLAALASCDAAGPEARAAGTYAAETYAVIAGGAAQDLVPAGARFDLVLTADGRFTSEVSVPNPYDGTPGFSERMTGTYRLDGDAVVFDTGVVRSSILALPWTLDGTALRARGRTVPGSAAELDVTLRRRP